MIPYDFHSGRPGVNFARVDEMPLVRVTLRQLCSRIANKGAGTCPPCLPLPFQKTWVSLKFLLDMHDLELNKARLKSTLMENNPLGLNL